ncbi:hypothetical protein AALP_AA3G214200 [Arabis alpina]|uniref:MADS-box domain-containing protein n=1 Tax=Arabis alpina TaxID=50452 RepID=A0A087HAR3_ARAAL|nr:hypothetical protein AALP_AA3G214200 [Arabis alpina]
MASSSSSTSATKKKASSTKTSSLAKREDTVFKKANELSILCGIEVCVIFYGSNGKLRTWPENREEVQKIARRYSELSLTKRRKGSVDLVEFLEKINSDDSKDKKKKRKVMRVASSNHKFSDWDPRFDSYSVEQLTELYHTLESKQTILQHRFQAVVEAQKQRMMQNTNYMAVQEQRMMTLTVSTMNHLQQHPNNVSMYPFNHGNGTFSHMPVQAPAFNQAPDFTQAPAFNQGQSLAPLPNSLTIYQNPTAENYSMLLGPQETPFQNMNMNMLTYNNNVNDLSRQVYQNCKVDNYPGKLGVQDTGMNQFQNPNMQSYNNFDVESYLRSHGIQDTGINGLQNMYGYNNNGNTNGLSHQFAQFPNQRAGPAFQFGSSHTQY